MFGEQQCVNCMVQFCNCNKQPNFIHVITDHHNILQYFLKDLLLLKLNECNVILMITIQCLCVSIEQKRENEGIRRREKKEASFEVGRERGRSASSVCLLLSLHITKILCK